MGNIDLFSSIHVRPAPRSVDVLNRNTLVASMSIDWQKGEVRFIQKSELLWDLPFPELGTGEGYTSVDRLLTYFEGRCFPRSRGDAEKILNSLGMSNYSPLGIVRKTHGVLFDDYVWLRFEGEENLTYEDIGYRQ